MTPPGDGDALTYRRAASRRVTKQSGPVPGYTGSQSPSNVANETGTRFTRTLHPHTKHRSAPPDQELISLASWPPEVGWSNGQVHTARIWRTARHLRFLGGFPETALFRKREQIPAPRFRIPATPEHYVPVDGPVPAPSDDSHDETERARVEPWSGGRFGLWLLGCGDALRTKYLASMTARGSTTSTLKLQLASDWRQAHARTRTVGQPRHSCTAQATPSLSGLHRRESQEKAPLLIVGGFVWSRFVGASRTSPSFLLPSFRIPSFLLH